VTSSLEKLSSQFPHSDNATGSDKDKGKSKGFNGMDLAALANDPHLKRSLQTHSRDALVLLDRALKHPVVITGVSGFARQRGIPHADALLRLASLGLARIIRTLPEGVQENVANDVEAKIEEIDAEELERHSSMAEREEAEKVGKAGEGAPPKVEGRADKQDPYEEMRKKNECIVM